MGNEISEISLLKMIEMGDPKNMGYVNFNNFMRLMQDIGLIRSTHELDLENSDMENMAFKAADNLKANW